MATTLTGLFSEIADAIRNLKGTSSTIVANNFPDEITALATSMASTTASASDVLAGKTAYLNKVLTTGTMPTAALGVNTSGGSGAANLSAYTSTASGWTNAASGSATTTAPSSGVYVKVDSAAKTISNTVTPKVVTAGYSPITTGSSTSFNSTITASSIYIPIKTSSVAATTITTQGGTYTVPVGYVTTATVIKANITAGKATTPATTITKVPTLTNSNGTFTVSVSGTQSVTPTVSAGYISTGTAGTITVTGSKTYNATDLDSNLKAGNILSGVKIFGVTGTIATVDLQTTANTFTQVNNFSATSTVTSSSTTGTITIGTDSVEAGLVASSGIKGAKVYNAVWNDLADLIPVDDECELEYGRCYCFNGSKYYKSRKYLDDGIIGIHSDTAGFEMGHKEGFKELKCSVAGFVLAYVDQIYEVGTLLTCDENGTLTKISNEDKINYPEKIIASYWKDEPEEYWGSEKKKVLVNGRKWVKVR